MDNYERVRVKAAERRRSAAQVSRGESLYRSSDLLKRLAAEIGYRPQLPREFAGNLERHSSALDEAHSKRLEDAERMNKQKAVQSQVEPNNRRL
jgi:hypothetical protein